MCWNKQVSLQTFLISLGVCAVLIQRQKPYDIVFASLLLFYSSIQLAEYFMWESLETHNVKLNKLATKFAYYSLWSHMFGLGLGIYLETQKTFPLVLGCILFAFGVVLEPQDFSLTQIQNDCKSSKGSCHLQWGFDNRYYIVIFLCAMYSFYAYTDVKYTWIAYPFYIVSYILSYAFHGQGSASYWCWISAALSFLLLFR